MIEFVKEQMFCIGYPTRHSFDSLILQNTCRLLCDTFYEGAHVEPRECDIDNYSTAVITTGGC